VNDVHRAVKVRTVEGNVNVVDFNVNAVRHAVDEPIRRALRVRARVDSQQLRVDGRVSVLQGSIKRMRVRG
jgi:hypothetical protein